MFLTLVVIAAALPEVALREVGGRGGLYANAAVGGREFWEGRAGERGAQAAGRGPGGAVPGAGGDGRPDGGEVAQGRAGEDGQLGQALSALGGVDELAVGADHLLGRQGQLLHRPAV